jgi:predicted RNA binding protein YcfA (HicA-like mRNA interferase family)
VISLGQWDKLISQILKLDKNLRYNDLAKALVRIVYTQSQSKGGSSHVTFRKPHAQPVTIPKGNPINKVYIELVRDAIIRFESEAR